MARDLGIEIPLLWNRRSYHLQYSDTVMIFSGAWLGYRNSLAMKQKKFHFFRQWAIIQFLSLMVLTIADVNLFQNGSMYIWNGALITRGKWGKWALSGVMLFKNYFYLKFIFPFPGLGSFSLAWGHELYIYFILLLS